MDPDELQKTLADLNAEKERIEQLAKAYEMVARHQQQTKSAAAPIVPAPIPTKTAAHRDIKRSKLPKAQLVRNAVTKVGNTFKLEDVIAYVPVGSMTRKEISFALSTMKRKGKIFVSEAGLGKAQSTYTKIKPHVQSDLSLP